MRADPAFVPRGCGQAQDPQSVNDSHRSPPFPASAGSFLKGSLINRNLFMGTNRQVRAPGPIARARGTAHRAMRRRCIASSRICGAHRLEGRTLRSDHWTCRRGFRTQARHARTPCRHGGAIRPHFRTSRELACRQDLGTPCLPLRAMGDPRRTKRVLSRAKRLEWIARVAKGSGVKWRISPSPTMTAGHRRPKTERADQAPNRNSAASLRWCFHCAPHPVQIPERPARRNVNQIDSKTGESQTGPG